jgi:hypothetical protein
MSIVKANTYQDASGGSNAVFSGVASPTGSMGFRNRIINGNMAIDQRNAGASASLTSAQTYFLDRWFAVEDTDGTMTIQQSSTAPTGFSNSALLTTGTADSSLGATQICYVGQKIEGYNVADLAWGTASAQTVTLSFWVRSSLTGTFGGAIANNAFNRSYPFTYTISAANTFEYKTITIAGDTTGTWLTTNSAGIQVFWGLGVGSTFSGTAGAWAGSGFISATGATSVIGTAGATFYITGVQLEAGTNASAFEQIDYGRELIMCQRYFETNYDIGTTPANGTSTNDGYKAGIFTAGLLYGLHPIKFTVTKRATPTITYYRPSQTATNGQWGYFSGGWIAATGTATDQANTTSFGINTQVTGLTTQNAYFVHGGWAASSEL